MSLTKTERLVILLDAVLERGAAVRKLEAENMIKDALIKRLKQKIRRLERGEIISREERDALLGETT